MKASLLCRITGLIRGLLAVSLCLTVSTPAHAFQFTNQKLGLSGAFDTTLSYGVGWRTQARDPGRIAITNGGMNRSPNEDDGNLNYGRGAVINSVWKASHDLDLKYKNYGVFVRGAYFYDQLNRTKPQLNDEVREIVGKDLQVLDAYGSANFDVAGRKLALRYGRQVVSWGESTYIQNGINVINPVDVNKLRLPGAQLKEGLQPTPMFWASQEIGGGASVEAVYMTHWYKTRIDPSGSYFSDNDFLSPGSDRVFLGFGRRNDQHLPPLTLNANANAAAWALRTSDQEARDDGQYGLAFRYQAPWLNNSEFSFYHANYHSRIPYATGVRGGVRSAANALAVLNAPCTVWDVSGGATAGACNVPPASYFAEYPEDIKLFGLGFNTQGPWGMALQGEYSYRPNMPLQIASPEVLLAAVGLSNQITGPNAKGHAYGAVIPGYRRVKMSQAQLTATQAFGPTFGANQFVLLGEGAVTMFHDLPNGLYFNGPGVYLPAPGSSTALSGGSTQPGGYLTATSYGYRLVSKMDFENFIGAVRMSPEMAFRHDINGVGPNFTQGQKAISPKLVFNYLERWQLEGSYNLFWGGRTFYGSDPTAPTAPGQTRPYYSHSNTQIDRDFVSLSLSYTF